jgi:hypothetical protein
MSSTAGVKRSVATTAELEYSRRCLQIVESLLEVVVTNSDVRDFLDKCLYITRNHYHDLSVERSLCDLCGYPLCGNRLSTTSKSWFGAKQVYKIDTKKNHIYRTEDIKHFCSDLCLISSNYLRKQISEEPVYLRTHDTISALKGIHVFDKSMSSEAVVKDLKPQPVDITAKTDPKPQQKARDLIGYPYIKEDLLDELKDQMNDLTIKERRETRADPQESDSEVSDHNSDQNSDNEDESEHE